MNKDFKKIIFSLHPLERKVLPYVNLKTVDKISKESKLNEAEVTKGLQLLEAKSYLKIDKVDEKIIVLDKFGIQFFDKNLPEILLLKELSNGEKKMSQLSLDKEIVGSAMGILKRDKLIEIRKEDEMILKANTSAKDYLKKADNPLKLFKKEINVKLLNKEQKEAYEILKKRQGFLREISKKSFTFELTNEGKKISDLINKDYSNLDLLETLDSEMLKKGTWKNREFRHYGVTLNTLPSSLIARRHPMIEANNILRDIFVEMGFKEMSGPMVESAFWNMDTMWIPQDHPAREDMDTFYVDGVAKVPKELIKKVKNMHEKGLNRTHTQENEWSEKITKRRLLRTHSTATTFRTLAKLGEELKKGKEIDGKYFYIAPVFRNETIDATHLAEFYQGEGFIIGNDLSLAHLMGFIKEYYAKLGVDKIKFKPTYNPYTEPSMEAHYYDSKLKKWYSLINSGIFRQETLEPLGLKGKTIIAWGMGASRVAALLSRKDSMRDITGNTCDFEWLKTRPMMKRRIVR